MANKGARLPLGATDSSSKPSRFPLGSAQSRAAARAMLAVRRSSGEDEQGVEVVYGAKGSVVEIRGLGEAINSAWLRLRNQAEGEPAAARTIGNGQDCGDGKGGDCLEERIRLARERLARARRQEPML